MSKTSLQWRALPYQSVQKENWNNLSWITIGWCNTWLLCTDVGCGSSANGLGCLQGCFLFCTGRKLKYLIPFLKEVFWHDKFPTLKRQKAIPRYLANQSRVPEGFVPGRHYSLLPSIAAGYDFFSVIVPEVIWLLTPNLRLYYYTFQNYGLPISHCWDTSLLREQYCSHYESEAPQKRILTRWAVTIQQVLK